MMHSRASDCNVQVGQTWPFLSLNGYALKSHMVVLFRFSAMIEWEG